MNLKSQFNIIIKQLLNFYICGSDYIHKRKNKHIKQRNVVTFICGGTIKVLIYLKKIGDMKSKTLLNKSDILSIK